MAVHPGLFDLDRRYAALSAAGDPLERLALVVDFEPFRAELDAALERSDRAKGGRPPYDAVLMFKVLVVQTLYTLSDDQTEYQIRDRLSFMRFLGLGLADAVPDANTIWTFREALSKAGAIEVLFRRFDQALKMSGYLAMGGQIVMAHIAPVRRNRSSFPLTFDRFKTNRSLDSFTHSLSRHPRLARTTSTAKRSDSRFGSSASRLLGRLLLIGRSISGQR
jgi:IS5 family transposase